MNIDKAKIAVIAALAGAALAAGTQSFAQHAGHAPAKPSAMQPGAKQIHDLMMRSAKMTMEMKMPMDNDTDRMFAKSMADHHGMGVKMAQIELKFGNDPGAKALAKKIIAAQTKEKGQLEKLGRTAR